MKNEGENQVRQAGNIDIELFDHITEGDWKQNAITD